MIEPPRSWAIALATSFLPLVPSLPVTIVAAVATTVILSAVRPAGSKKLTPVEAEWIALTLATRSAATASSLARYVSAGPVAAPRSCSAPSLPPGVVSVCGQV